MPRDHTYLGIWVVSGGRCGDAKAAGTSYIAHRSTSMVSQLVVKHAHLPEMILLSAEVAKFAVADM